MGDVNLFVFAVLRVGFAPPARIVDAFSAAVIPFDMEGCDLFAI